jgi:hypothetical protein
MGCGALRVATLMRTCWRTSVPRWRCNAHARARARARLVEVMDWDSFSSNAVWPPKTRRARSHIDPAQETGYRRPSPAGSSSIAHPSGPVRRFHGGDSICLVLERLAVVFAQRAASAGSIGARVRCEFSGAIAPERPSRVRRLANTRASLNVFTAVIAALYGAEDTVSPARALKESIP